MANLRKYCMVLYGLYGLSAMLQFSQSTLLISALILMLAYAMTARRKKAAKDTPFASHLRWMLRTFWIGTGVIVPATMIVAAFIILQFTDIIPVMAASMDGDSQADMMNAVQAYRDGHAAKLSFMMIAAMIPATVWWLRRCWIGYALAKKDKPVENVTSWL